PDHSLRIPACTDCQWTLGQRTSHGSRGTRVAVLHSQHRVRRLQGDPTPCAVNRPLVDLAEPKSTDPAPTAGGIDAALTELLFRTAGVAVAVVDRDLRYVRVNDVLAAMNGRPAAAHIGRTLHEVIP